MCALTDRDWLTGFRTIHSQASRVPGVECLVACDSYRWSSGQKRNWLTESSRGEYIAFVDDDDRVPAGYVESLLTAIETGTPDVVTFDLNMRRRGWPDARQSFRANIQDKGAKDGETVVMAANHLCAWRREIATRVRWDPALGYGDDQLWYKPLALAGTYTEAHIAKVLYEYRFSDTMTANQRADRIAFAKKRYGDGVEVFELDGQVLIGLVNTKVSEGQERVFCRGMQQDYLWCDRAEATRLGIVTIH